MTGERFSETHSLRRGKRQGKKEEEEVIERGGGWGGLRPRPTQPSLSQKRKVGGEASSSLLEGRRVEANLC